MCNMLHEANNGHDRNKLSPYACCLYQTYVVLLSDRPPAL